MFRDARWFTTDGHALQYDWDEGAGQETFAEARRQIDLANQHRSGRLSGMVCPAQVDTCSAALIEEAHGFSEEWNLPFQIHAAQNVTKFHEMFRRHGKTPIRWLHYIGALGSHSIIGHGIFLDHHPWLHWTTRKDLDLLAETGTTVAHCPTVFLRRGITLRTFGTYVRAGVNVGIGTDTYPHNFLEEMRSTANHARTMAETVDDVGPRTVAEPDICRGGSRNSRRLCG
ncbi:MAG: amidohydrolase family protein [Alphaproteobacteria bacterium]